MRNLTQNQLTHKKFNTQSNQVFGVEEILEMSAEWVPFRCCRQVSQNLNRPFCVLMLPWGLNQRYQQIQPPKFLSSSKRLIHIKISELIIITNCLLGSSTRRRSKHKPSSFTSKCRPARTRSTPHTLHERS